MGLWWKVFSYELSRGLRRKGFLFGTFGLPLLALLFLLVRELVVTNTPPSNDPPPDISNVVDIDGVNQAGYVDFSGMFTTIPASLENRLTRYDTLEEARAALTAKQIELFYVIHDDYQDSRRATMHLSGLQISVTSQTALLDRLVDETLFDMVDQTTLLRLRDPAIYQTFNLSPTVANAEIDAEDIESANLLVLYLFTIMFIGGLFFTNAYLMQSVIEEKENRVIEILLASMRPLDLLGGKILAFGILGMVQIVTWLLGVILVFNVAQRLPSLQAMNLATLIQLPTDMIPLMMIYFVLGYLLFAAIYGGVGAISNSLREGPQYAILFTLPAGLPYYFVTVFQQTPHATLPTVLSLFPLSSPVAMILRLTVSSEVPMIEVVASLVLLALSVLGAIWLSGRLFRVQSLLAGQAPKLRDVLQLLRG